MVAQQRVPTLQSPETLTAGSKILPQRSSVMQPDGIQPVLLRSARQVEYHQGRPLKTRASLTPQKERPDAHLR